MNKFLKIAMLWLLTAGSISSNFVKDNPRYVPNEGESSTKRTSVSLIGEVSEPSTGSDRTIVWGGTVSDLDGNVYRTVIIGNQEWMAENLKVTKFRNGDDIQNVIGNSEWSTSSKGLYTTYNNNERNAATYGYLYNWYAVNDSRKLALPGWHIPTDNDWKELERYFGMRHPELEYTGYRETDAGGQLKEYGVQYWNSPDSGATNKRGFTEVSGGYRFYSGFYCGLNNSAIFWSSTECDSSKAWFRSLHNGNSSVFRNFCNKNNGFSVRLVRDK